jgi:hypothetical protein
LLLVAFAISLPLGWLGWQAHVVSHRREMRKLIEANGHDVFAVADILAPGAVDIDYYIPWTRRMLGDREILGIDFHHPPQPEVIAAARAFPEAQVSWPNQANR